MMVKHGLMLAFWAASLLVLPSLAYEPTWESLESRPLPSWYDEAKIGIFIHWGVFSVPAFGTEWFWERWAGKKSEDFIAYVNATETNRFNYPDYAHRFDATLYDPDFWADVFAKSGAQYVVLTSKHHEGFCNWDSRKIPTTWNWNAMDIGPRRDLVGDLAKAIRKPNVKSPQTNKLLKFGVYHSLYEWFNPMYTQDQTNDLKTQTFVDTKTMPELYELVEKYQPEVIWSDGAWTAPSSYWKSATFLAWLATNSSVKDTVVWNDRWGNDTRCKYGSFLNCADRYLPNTTMEHKFENAMTLDKYSWGRNRRSNAADYFTTKELIDTLVQTISRNGNLLVNVGPGADGTISPIMVDRLLGMGDWLSVNGEGVYKTRPWTVCDRDLDESVFYTRNEDTLYAHLTEWPAGNAFTLACPQQTDSTEAHMLGLESNAYLVEVVSTPGVRSSTSSTGINLKLPALTPNVIPCQHVWVIAMKGIGNLDDKLKSKEA